MSQNSVKSAFGNSRVLIHIAYLYRRKWTEMDWFVWCLRLCATFSLLQ